MMTRRERFQHLRSYHSRPRSLAYTPFQTCIPSRQVIDPTKLKPRAAPQHIEISDDCDLDDSERFDPNAEIGANAGEFGAPDPYMYMDPNKANEDMKKLVEAAFEASMGVVR
ncbi:hypothetical protein CBER1_11877 [Cercospora berteroae]|uniref:Uncharacterized protein n=1 Tax=Cercospora berteroae TaxID=357750 RepID=A0A2S6BWN3_9PEZI|nr:hypothetical protein CBER1_11877 [Cercospora berteroae]